jgi:hypothetical protein
MYLVYLLPLLLIVLLALVIFTGPVIAVLAFVLLLVALGGYKFLGRGTEPEHAPASQAPAGGAQVGGGGSNEAEGGMWGEKWPEQRQGEEPS